MLSILAKHRDCCLLTKDSDFHRHPAVKQALMDHRIGAFVITAHKNRTVPQLVELIARAWKPMMRFAQHHDCPFVAKIHATGRVEDAT